MNRDAWPGALGLGVFALALWAQPDGVIGSFFDDGVYVVLAKGLAEGQGFRNIHLPDAPPGVHYPILYPALLSLLWRLWPSFPDNVALFQLFDAAVLGASAWVLARYAARSGLPPLARYTALVLGFSAFPLLTLVGVRFSEPLFLLIALAAVAVADREVVSRRTAVLAGALCGLSFLARSVGLAVIAGVTLALFLRRERRAAAIALAVALAFVLPWMAWTASRADQIDPRIAANYGTYVSEARQAGLGALVSGLDLRALAPVARLVIPVLPAVLWYLLALLLVGAVGWGAWRLAPRMGALVTTAALYALMISLWPYVPDRFMWIMLPVIALFLAEGMRAAWRSGPVLRGAAVVLAIVIAVGYLRREANSVAYRHFVRTAEDGGRFIALLSPAIATGTPDSAIVATEAEAAVYLYSGRRTVPSALFRWEGRGTVDLSPETTVGYFCDMRVTHVALSAGEGGVAPVVAMLEARNDSSVVPLFRLSFGPALYRFRCPQ